MGHCLLSEHESGVPVTGLWRCETCFPSPADRVADAAKDVLSDMPRIVAQADIERLRSDLVVAEEARVDDPNTLLRRLALSYRRYGDAGYLYRVGGLIHRIDSRIMTRHAKTAFDTTTSSRLSLGESDATIAVAG